MAGVSARASAELLAIQINTATRFFMRLRQRIAGQPPRYDLSGEVEADERYFGGTRKGRRGRGAAGKVVVFGLLKRFGKVYTVMIPNAKTTTLLPIIQEKVTPDSIVYTDRLNSDNALDVSEFKHGRINPSRSFADRQNHINGIENFPACALTDRWNPTKRLMRWFNGNKTDNFYWFLKECEWRFNGSNHKMLLNQLKHGYKHTKH